jgi:hypothetical protein
MSWLKERSVSGNNETTSSHRDSSSRFASTFGEKAQLLGRSANTIRSHVPVPIPLVHHSARPCPTGICMIIEEFEGGIGL